MKINKYFKWYNQIIDKALSEDRKKYNGIYYENHHIIPKSIRPDLEKDKSNQVLLTAREHFICHILLPKFLIRENKSKMMLALNRLAHNKKYINSYLYEQNKINLHKEFSTPDKNGLTEYQKRALKSIETMKNTTINGKTLLEIKTEKRIKTIKNNNLQEKITEKFINTMSKVDNNGLNGFQKQGLTLSKKMKNNPKYQGKNSSNAKIYGIYDIYGKLMFIAHGNLEHLCKKYNMPFRAFQKSIDKNPVYYNLKKHTLKRIMNNGNLFYKNWTIKTIPSLTNELKHYAQ